MAEFLDQYTKDKAGQGKLLKVKFSVSARTATAAVVCYTPRVVGLSSPS
jgi:hypothetical protein